MMYPELLYYRLRRKLSRQEALDLINDPRTLIMKRDLNVGDFKTHGDFKNSLASIYDWMYKHLSDFEYLSNYALSHADLHSFDRRHDSPHQDFDTYILIHDENERMLFKLKFADLIKTL